MAAFASNVIQQFEQTGVILSPWWAPWRPTSLFDPCFWIQKDAESRCWCPEIVWAQSFPYHPAFQPLAAFMQKGSWRDLWWQIFHLFWATMCNSKENISKTHGISFINRAYASAYAWECADVFMQKSWFIRKFAFSGENLFYMHYCHIHTHITFF